MDIRDLIEERQEFVNAMIVLERRKALKAQDAAQAFRQISGSNMLADRDLTRLDTLAQITRRFELSACDAIYLELAMRLRLPLACRDGALNAALPRAGVVLA